MSVLKRLVTSSIGKKFIVALSGVGALLFLIMHLFGNLIIFLGADRFNAYAHMLHSIPFLPLIQTALGAIFVIHIVFTLCVTFENRRARPVGYAQYQSGGGRSLASSSMIYSGSIILCFILVHIWGMKFGKHARAHSETFDIVSAVLATSASVIFYLIGFAAVGLHLSHGISSAFQSSGMSNRHYGKLLAGLAHGLAWAMALGFAAIAIYLYLAAKGHA